MSATSTAEAFQRTWLVPAVTHFLAAEPEASLVWCFVATIGFLAFGVSSIWDPIWMGSNWRVGLLKLMDGALYGVAMGLPFYLLF